ncbi:protoglobin domain-containing protein [Acidipropionibacterium virtanenii]|uniref:Globin-sensor domain-containing protein n=1 Tax=Acidipropionibacterium virtanenii TaxID=2057246 RepID=A0A344UQE4_9ACTN|nr:protoglobin domain-containing protein [Acidipropionibacterium virtanenii]AXE37492.1 hypothetical protein JS278_00295 [Acidipropionibacterium virtanenii]
MHAIAQAAVDQTPPNCRVSAEQAAVIARHADILESLGPGIVDAFYETLYAHEPTAAVFKDGERPMREESLHNWWRRTVRGPIDDQYWSWMAMVGLIHVIRRVTNPMMLAMAQFVADYLDEHSDRLELDFDEEQRVVEAFRRVAAMTGSVITWGYDHAVSSSLFEVAGMPEALLARLRDEEVKSALVSARKEVTRN